MTPENVENVSAYAEAMRVGDWEAASKAMRRHVPLHNRMGLTIVRHEPNQVVMVMELSDEVRGAAEGSVHGGMLATLADVASASVLWGAFDYDTEIPVTTDMHIRYYRQPHGGPLTAKAELVHKGRRILSCECAVEDVQKRVLARSTATYMIVPKG